MFSQSPACGRPDESDNAQNRTVGAEKWCDASSMARERWHCRMEISISSRPSQSRWAAARAETAALCRGMDLGDGPGRSPSGTER